MNDKSEIKVYSPDITPYSMEGKSGIFGTLLSIIVAPIRLLSRIMHNVFVLSAEMQGEYASGLFIVGTVMAALGLLDLLIYQKWPLLVSQVPVLYYAVRLKVQAQRSTIVAQEKREVDMQYEKVEELVNTIYNDLNKILEE